MGTFLTTRRMDPALAARIEASVSGRKASESTWRPRLVAIARLAAVVAVVTVVVGVMALRRRDRRELEASRAALLDTVHAASASLTPEQKDVVPRAESWVKRAAGAYEGDFVADDLRPAGALAAVMARPAVYVRGPMETLGSGNAAGVAGAASASFKDPFVVCLVEPPASRTEKVLLAKVHAAYARTAEERTPNVRRLHDADAGLPFLMPPWAERIQMAPGEEELEKLRSDFERAPIEAAKRAAKATVLLFAIDEPGEPGVPAELDGERPHNVRVGLVDLASSRVLLRMRKRVDPSWISAAKRTELASGLDGCALAMDVVESVRGGR